MSDARRVLDRGGDLAVAQGEIGERLARLSRLDDLTRHGRPIGPTDASTGGYLLWREPPHFTLALGSVAVLPPPPRAIHSHNNLHPGTSLELIFSAVEPVPAAERMLYDVPAGTCRPSWFEVSDRLSGDSFP